MNEPPDRHDDAWARYVCTICGWVYDPKAGDSIGGFEAGTPFAELPAQWRCPMCYAGKEKFERLND